MTKQTAQFLLNLLDAQQLNAGAPDLEQVVTLIVTARTELNAVLNQQETTRG